MVFNKLINQFKNKRLLILGFGKEGRDTLRFLRRLFPKKIIGVGDRNINLKAQNSKLRAIRWHLGTNYLGSLKKYDVVIKSPGIPIHLPQIEMAFKRGKITSQTEIFFENCPAIIIGVTGSKGKGTTSRLIYEIFKKAGIKAYLVGNIGRPALSLLSKKIEPKSIIIYELSSHQLYKIKKSPKIAVLLNIYPAHLDYFKNFKEYINTKKNITRYQEKKDYLIYNPENKIVKNIARGSKAKIIPISIKSLISKSISSVLKRNKSPLIGNFNLFNIAAAKAVVGIFDIKEKTIIDVLKSFKNQPHRLEYVGTFKGIKFYNDSSSTIPESTIGAIEALKENLQTLIVGGSESGISFQKLAQEIIKTKIKTLILFPTTGKKIWNKIRQINKRKNIIPFFANNMSEAVKIAYSETAKGKTCLLSPASPSFTLFSDYKERGELFKKYVKKFSKQTI